MGDHAPPMASSGGSRPVREHRFTANLAGAELVRFREALVDLAGGFTEIASGGGTRYVVGLTGPRREATPSGPAGRMGTTNDRARDRARRSEGRPRWRRYLLPPAPAAQSRAWHRDAPSPFHERATRHHPPGACPAIPIPARDGAGLRRVEKGRWRARPRPISDDPRASTRPTHRAGPA